MFLFILESIGMQELLLVGVVCADYIRTEKVAGNGENDWKDNGGIPACNRRI